MHDSLWNQEEVGIPSPTAEYLGTYPVSLTTTQQVTVAGTMPSALAPTANLVERLRVTLPAPAPAAFFRLQINP